MAILEGDEEGLRAVLQEINTSLLNGTCRLPRYYEDIKNWALLNSAKYGSLKIIQIVLEARCNVQTTNEEGNTALSLTCYRSQSIPPCQSYKVYITYICEFNKTVTNSDFNKIKKIIFTDCTRTVETWCIGTYYK